MMISSKTLQRKLLSFTVACCSICIACDSTSESKMALSPTMAIILSMLCGCAISNPGKRKIKKLNIFFIIYLGRSNRSMVFSFIASLNASSCICSTNLIFRLLRMIFRILSFSKLNGALLSFTINPFIATR